MALFDVENIY